MQPYLSLVELNIRLDRFIVHNPNRKQTPGLYPILVCQLIANHANNRETNSSQMEDSEI